MFAAIMSSCVLLRRNIVFGRVFLCGLNAVLADVHRRCAVRTQQNSRYGKYTAAAAKVEDAVAVPKIFLYQFKAKLGGIVLTGSEA